MEANNFFVQIGNTIVRKTNLVAIYKEIEDEERIRLRIVLNINNEDVFAIVDKDFTMESILQFLL